MRRRDLSRALFISAAGAATLFSKRAEAQTYTAPRYAQTAAETAAGVTPYNTNFPPGQVDRYIHTSSPMETVANAFTYAGAQAQQAGGSPVLIGTLLTLNASVMLPVNVPIIFSGTGTITIPSGVVLTLQGPMFGARTQVFQANGPNATPSPQGTVVFTQSAGPEVYPEWWGCHADSTGGVAGTDNTQPLQACLIAAAGGSGVNIGLLPVVLSDGYYLTGNQLLPLATCIRGTGRAQCGFIALAGTSGQASGLSAGAWFTDTGNAEKIILQDFAMYGNYANCPNIVYGLRLGYNLSGQHGTEGYLRGLWIRDCACYKSGYLNGFQCDINGNVGYYDLITTYCNNQIGQSGLRIAGAGNLCSKFESQAVGSPAPTPSAWSSTTPYLVNAIVSYSGSYYYCVAANTGQVPTNATYWTFTSLNTINTYGICIMAPATQISGCEVEGPSNYAIPLSIQANADIDGVFFSLQGYNSMENTGVLDHIWEIGPSVTSWKVTGVNYITAGTTTITGGNAMRADGTYFGGNASGSATYSPSTPYHPKSVVTYGGNSYICTLANTGTGHTPPNLTYWFLYPGYTYTTWSNTTAYVVGAIVTNGTNYYICIAANTGQLLSNTTYWSLYTAEVTATSQYTGDGNYFSETSGLRSQTFSLHIKSVSGVIQHRISEANGNPTAFATLINESTSNFNNTPVGSDSSTAMNFGGKIGSGSTNTFWLDTPDQQSVAYTDALAILSYNTSSTAVQVQGAVSKITINGLIRYRLNIEFWQATGGAAVPIATLLSSGYEVIVTFKGSLSP
jgi:hypothetical protein